MKTTAWSRVGAIRIGLLTQAVLLIDVAFLSISGLPEWRSIDDMRRVLAMASRKPVDHTYMTFFPGTFLHFDITLVQFGYLGILLPALMAIVLVLLALWIRKFSNRSRLITSISEAVLTLVMVIATDAHDLDPVLLALGAFVTITVLAPVRSDQHKLPFAPA